MEILPLSSPLVDIAAIILGLIVGSFINVCIYRLPKEQSIVRPRSSCPSCKKPIAWYDNIPVLSFVILRGRCRSCGAKISARYPIVEMLTALISWLILRHFGATWLYAVWFPYSAALLTLSVIDLDHRIIPDEISLPGILIGLALSLFTPLQPFLTSLFGALLGGGMLLVVGLLYEVARKQEGIGGGDIKLMAMVGAFAGWKGAMFTIFAGSIIGSVAGVSIMFLRRSGTQTPIPFGPFLSFASFSYLLFGERLIHAYFGLLQP